MRLRVRAAQSRIEQLYRFECGFDVADFVIDAEQRAALAEALGLVFRGRESLLVNEGADELLLALYLDEELHSADPLKDADLDRALALFEGVSHLVYVHHRAQGGRSVTLLELELQAEVDKFVGTWLARWQAGAPLSVTRLWQRLFHEFELVADAQDHGRYLAANRLARRYCAWLTRDFFAPDQLDGLWPEIRRFWRMGHAAKIAHIESR